MKDNNYIFYKLVIASIGVFQIFIGVLAAYYGPLEIYAFHLFSQGGPYHYEGFKFGSFWYGLLVFKNIAYYIIAALLIPIGYGNLKLRRWTLTLSRLYIWLWLLLGTWLLVNLIALIPFILNLDLASDTMVQRLVITGLIWLTGFCVLPIALFFFYKNANVREIFKDSGSKPYWTERYPFALLLLLPTYAVYFIILHLALFFQAIFPFFGKILWGRPAAYILSFCILLLPALMYGIVKLRPWAWWGSLVYFSCLTASTVTTVIRYKPVDIIHKMNLPEFELDLLHKISIWQGLNLFTLFVLPLVGALGWLIFSKSCFPIKETLEQSFESGIKSGADYKSRFTWLPSPLAIVINKLGQSRDMK